ncbi:MAG: hypothetical protein WA510_32790, partial [Acidobacteriaceae bacterium]
MKIKSCCTPPGRRFIGPLLLQLLQLLPVLLLLIAVPGFAQRPALTTDWIVNAGSKVDAVPAFAWLADNTAIVDDVRLPATKRVFERLDPSTGKRHPIVDMKKALASLRSLELEAGPVAKAPDTLPWPVVFDGAGKQALYL